MFFTDALIGFYNNMFFVYLSLFLIVFIFFKINKKIKLKNLFIFSFVGSLIFFLVSNLGVWILTDMYNKNINGLFSTIIFSYGTFLTNNILNKKLASLLRKIA